VRNKTGATATAEIVFIGSLFRILRDIPFSWSVRISRGLLRLVLSILRKRRRLIHEQIALSFPGLPAVEHRKIAEQCLDNLAKGIALFPRIPSLVKNGIDDVIETEGFEHLDEALRQGRGVITFTAHYGCWEIMAVHVTARYPLVSMVVRPLDNLRVDNLVSSVRSSGGGGVIDSRRVLKEGIRLLRQNGILGVLIDQNFHKGGVFVDFFGRAAATNTLVPILARRTECVVLPMHNVWKNGKVRIICEAPVALSQNPDLVQAIQEDTQKLTGYVEKWIREEPGQWLWLHNRWKRRPENEQSLTAGGAGGR